MQRLGTVTTLLTVLFCTSGTPTAQTAHTVQQAPQATPCLSGDPYKLAQLRAVISSTTPPSAPVIISSDLSAEFVRKGTMDDSDELMAQGKTRRGEPNPSETPANETRLDLAALRIFNTATQFEFRVKMSEQMLRAIATCHERNGLTEAGGTQELDTPEARRPTFLPLALRTNETQAAPASAPPPDKVAQGWSNNDDSRIVRTPTTLWPWRAITQSSSWPDGNQSRCTMTLIGPRHLVTAAHCLVNFGTSSWKTRKLTPARDGDGVAPYGVSQMTPNPPPGQASWYIVPDQWLDPNTPDDTDKYQWDIGLVLMQDRLGDQTGWMGYGAITTSDLNQQYHYNRGYPGCQDDYSEKPAGCQRARLYGDTKECEIGDYDYEGSNGWNRMFSFSCDISRGHSGSAIYHYRYSQSKGRYVPVVIGVVSWHECLQCEDGDNYPNHARRITPWVYSSIGWLREQFP